VKRPATDMAIIGDGFFAVQTPAGDTIHPAGQISG
jgi:flagellar basal body rod protein FlgG